MFKMPPIPMQIGVSLDTAKKLNVAPEVLIIDALRYEYGAHCTWDRAMGKVYFTLPNLHTDFVALFLRDNDMVFIEVQLNVLTTSRGVASIPQ